MDHDVDTNPEYTLDQLLDRAYTDLEAKRTMTSKLSIPPPEVGCVNKRTIVGNFSTICGKINRSEVDVQTFFNDELSCKSSIDAKGELILGGIFRQKGIENIISSYIKQYVMCKECKSMNTEHIKEDRILFMKCNTCLAKKAIT